jgi:hypothetical protein
VRVYEREEEREERGRRQRGERESERERERERERASIKACLYAPTRCVRVCVRAERLHARVRGCVCARVRVCEPEKKGQK